MAPMNNDERSVLAVGGFGLGVVALAFAGFAISRTNSNSSSSAGSAGAGLGAAASAVDVNLAEFAMTPAMLDVPPGDVLDRLLRVEDIARVQFPSEVQVLVKPRVDGIDLHAVYGRAEANHWKWDRAFGEMGHRMHGAGVAGE